MAPPTLEFAGNEFWFSTALGFLFSGFSFFVIGAQEVFWAGNFTLGFLFRKCSLGYVVRTKILLDFSPNPKVVQIFCFLFHSKV